MRRFASPLSGCSARMLRHERSASPACPSRSSRCAIRTRSQIAPPRVASVARSRNSDRFQRSRAKAGSGSLAALAGLDIGYCWEAEKNYDAAEKAYLSTISGAKPKDFLYEEAMVDAARAQELGGKRAEAVETYQRLLKDLPDSRRAEEIRSRLASLQTPAKP